MDATEPWPGAARAPRYPRCRGGQGSLLKACCSSGDGGGIGRAPRERAEDGSASADGGCASAGVAGDPAAAAGAAASSLSLIPAPSKTAFSRPRSAG